ncbi:MULTISPECIES: glycosyltransferase family A protein [unclassified Photobacterium]|uniref:glycosyltransferase family 2 protein n=1 Tax=unclassified Photobacterium TaxID=2628852 RepID=UPI001EE03C1F|nr:MULTISPECIES: glycosyltransferase family A protein [unclassified Photobacterium]MCG3864091.1 glycosyltransferase family 2 protein [Photobacterium sp. Ph6]MCG3875621.1 glycosyltransferase family 2 protein [Photobacterium sp. Ph5]
MLPKVTYVILSYNQALFIESAVNSVLTQNYSNIEIIISDDCSSDETIKILSQYKSLPNVTVTQTQKNNGVVSNLNHASKFISGEYVFLMGGDDISYPDRTEKVIAYFDKEPNLMCVYTDTNDMNYLGKLLELKNNSGFKYFKRNGDLDVVSMLKMDLGVLGCSASYKTSVFKQFPLMGNNYISEDKILTLRSLLIGKVGFINDKLVYYRLGTGISNNTGQNDFLSYFKIYRGKLKTYNAYLNDQSIKDRLSFEQLQLLSGLSNFYTLCDKNLRNPKLQLFLQIIFSKYAPMKEKLRYLYMLYLKKSAK